MRIAFISGWDENLGIGYLSSALKRLGHEVKLFIDPQLFDDENMSFGGINKLFNFKKKILNNIISFNPDLICFSVVSDFYQWACKLAESIKEKTNIPIIFGGIHPTVVPEYVIMNKYVDMVCIGEGESAICELADSFKPGSSNNYHIRNIWFKNNGIIIKNPVRPLFVDLNSLPFPDKELFYRESSHFKKAYYIVTSRGCSYPCTYCCHHVLQRIYTNPQQYERRRSVSNVMSELNLNIKKYAINFVRIFDDTFASDKEWLRDFSVRYRQEIGVPFSCCFNPKDIDEEIVILLKRAGCYEVEIGVQTWSEVTRQRILKRFVSNQKIEDAINIFKKNNIRIAVDNIFGLPGQTEEEVLELANFYNRNRVNRIYFFGLRYYPKTEISQIAKNFGLIDDQEILKLNKSLDTVTFVRGGDVFGKEFKQLQTLFSLLPHLTFKANRVIINKKLYRFFPPLPYMILNIFSNWFRIKFKYNWQLQMTLKRYYKYCLISLKDKLIILK